MQKQLLSFIAIIGIAFLSATSCSKSKDDPGTTPKTNTDLITQANWRFSTATISGVDASSYLQACQKDNTMSFAAAGTGSVDEGATKCNGSDPQTNPFTWSFSTETTLFVSTPLFTGGSSSFGLVTLSETQLVVSQTFTSGPANGQTVVVTFIH